MIEKIESLAKELDLDIRTFNPENVATICAEPYSDLLETLNSILGYDYYGGWCDDLDLVKIEIKKKDFEIVISTWMEDDEINDAVTIYPNDFSVIERIINSADDVMF